MKITIPIRGSRGDLSDKKVSVRNFETVLGKGKIRFQMNTETVEEYYGPSMSPFVSASMMAFTEHLPLRIEPAHFWVTIIQEVATMVKQNPKKYAHVFNGDPDHKKILKVICDELANGDQHWPLAIGRFRSALCAETGVELVEGFFPNFSTDDPTRELVYLVSAMDAASPYFEYEVHTRCGIPEIQLEGTLEDWSSLYKRLVWLEATFGRNVYFDRVKKIIDRIGQQVKSGQPDINFWSSFFKYQMESGGDKVTGWITDLYAYIYTEGGPVFKDLETREYGSNEFPSGLSVVPFTWVLLGDRFPMRFFSGFTGVRVVDEAVCANIGYGVIEGEK